VVIFYLNFYYFFYFMNELNEINHLINELFLFLPYVLKDICL